MVDLIQNQADRLAALVDGMDAMVALASLTANLRAELIKQGYSRKEATEAANLWMLSATQVMRGDGGK